MGRGQGAPLKELGSHHGKYCNDQQYQCQHTGYKMSCTNENNQKHKHVLITWALRGLLEIIPENINDSPSHIPQQLPQVPVLWGGRNIQSADMSYMRSPWSPWLRKLSQWSLPGKLTHQIIKISQPTLPFYLTPANLGTINKTLITWEVDNNQGPDESCHPDPSHTIRLGVIRWII